MRNGAAGAREFADRFHLYPNVMYSALQID